jgi:hypothetical protein
MPPTAARSPLSSAAPLKPNRNFLALAAATLCVLLFFALPLPAHADNTGLVGYWSFYDGAGTQATDFLR